MQQINEFRKEKDTFFKGDPHSPLTEEQKTTFTGLHYFPYSEKFFFHDLLLTEPESSTEFSLQTSAGDVEVYKRKGKITFSVDEATCTLTIFVGADGDLFLPFRDMTSENETYPAGRYVDVEEKDGKISVDFNYAYNPYCAYNERWRCPLTPAENKLSVRVAAGEKKFHQ